MDLGKKSGVMEVHILDFIQMLRNQDRVIIVGAMVIGMLANGRIIC